MSNSTFTAPQPPRAELNGKVAEAAPVIAPPMPVGSPTLESCATIQIELSMAELLFLQEKVEDGGTRQLKKKLYQVESTLETNIARRYKEATNLPKAVKK